MQINKPQKKVDVLKAQRLQKRDRIFRDAHGFYNAKGNYGGRYGIGRNEKGQAVKARRLEDLGITIEGWTAKISFKREDMRALEGKGWKDVEQLVANNALPRKGGDVKLDIISAVRLLKHVREGYEKEIGATDRLLAVLDTLNIQLSELHRPRQSEINAAIAQLEAFDANVLSKKQVAVKKIVARGEIRRLVEKLGKIDGSGSIDFGLGSACAIFTAFRNRIGTWRERQIAGIYARTLQRECALRAERDEMVYRSIAAIVENAERAYETYSLNAPKTGPPPAGSPQFILDGLQKSGENYLFRVVSDLEQGVGDFYSCKYGVGMSRFRDAIKHLGRIISQQQKN